MPHLEKLQKEIAAFKLPSHIRICSAHKQPTQLEATLKQYNRSIEPLMMVGSAGGTDALSGTASYLAKFPVVSCPPDGMNNTCLTNPPGSSNAFIVKPANIGKFCAQMFARSSPEVAEALDANIAEKITKLEGADCKLTGTPLDRSLPGVESAKFAGAAMPPLFVIAAGSDSDMPHLEKLQKELAAFKVESEIRI